MNEKQVWASVVKEHLLERSSMVAGGGVARGAGGGKVSKCSGWDVTGTWQETAVGTHAVGEKDRWAEQWVCVR